MEMVYDLSNTSINVWVPTQSPKTICSQLGYFVANCQNMASWVKIVNLHNSKYLIHILKNIYAKKTVCMLKDKKTGQRPGSGPLVFNI